MEYEIIIRPEAEQDLTAVFDWYEDRRRGLGFDFLLQVDAALRLIARDPEMWAAGYRGTRKHLIKRFPYKIIYIIEKPKIIIIGVIHGRRSPMMIQKRIGMKS